MKRRELLFGAATAAAGAGLLTGSEAFSQSVSHRQVRVEVASDEDAYLKLEELEAVTVNGTECETRVDLLSITNQSKLVLDSFQVEIELDDADAFTITVTDDSVPGRLGVGETGAVTVTVKGSGHAETTGTVVITAETVGPEGEFELHRSWQLTLEADCRPDCETSRNDSDAETSRNDSDAVSGTGDGVDFDVDKNGTVSGDGDSVCNGP